MAKGKERVWRVEGHEDPQEIDQGIEWRAPMKEAGYPDRPEDQGQDRSHAAARRAYLAVFPL